MIVNVYMYNATCLYHDMFLVLFPSGEALSVVGQLVGTLTDTAGNVIGTVSQTVTLPVR